MSRQMSVDECRRIQTSHRQMQANADECRRVTRLVQTNQKHFTLIPEKPTHVPIFLLLQSCKSRPHRRANLQFYNSFLTPLISKTHLHIYSLTICKLKRNCCSKDQSQKWVAPLRWGVGRQGRGGQKPNPPPPLPSPQNINIYETELPLFIEVCIFRMRFNLNKIFASDA